MKMIVYLMLAAIFLVGVLAGCTPAPVKIEPTIPMPTAKQSVDIDPELLQLCPVHLAKPAQGSYTQLQTVRVAASWDSQMYQCATLHNRLVVLVRKAFNLPALPENSVPIPAELQPVPQDSHPVQQDIHPVNKTAVVK